MMTLTRYTYLTDRVQSKRSNHRPRVHRLLSKVRAIYLQTHHLLGNPNGQYTRAYGYGLWLDNNDHS